MLSSALPALLALVAVVSGSAIPYTVRARLLPLQDSLTNICSQTAKPPAVCNLDMTSPTYCTGSAALPDADGRWLCDDERLGPKDLNLPAPLDTLVLGYDRLGGLCPDAYFKKWFKPTGRPNWPSNDGFAVRGGVP